MVAHVASESGVIRRMFISFVVVSLIAIVLRLASAAPGLVASVATIVSGAALIIGLSTHGRAHGARWRCLWAVLGAALLVQAVVTTQQAIAGLPRTFPVAGDWIRVGCASAVLLALCGLLSMRSRGCAGDALLQGATGVTVILYPVWVWAVMHGIAPGAAASALIPVAVWLVALWLLFRLVFLSREHIVAYRYLGVAFICLAVTNAMHAGATLDRAPVNRGPLLGFVLWAYCAWGAAALHPSLRKAFEPVQPRVPRFGTPTVVLCVAAALSGPVALAAFASGHDLRGLTGVVGGAAVAPALLALYLVRQVRNRARAEYRAQHDPLTGLPNQTLFQDRLDVALAHSRRYDTGLAVMFLDLDRFKAINDSLGHAVGNQLLQAVANRLRGTLRETDTVARMGGDEFTILLHNINDRDAAAVIARKIVEQFSRPFVAGGRELHTTASVGIALYPHDGADGDSLLKNADSAMYRAKARGRDAFEFYTQDLSTRAQARLSVESALRYAIDRRDLELHYQPQVDVRTGAIVGLEALARWPHKRFGMIMPNVFIPVAEETGLIAPMGDWALDEACAQLRRWMNAGLVPRPVAVNVSARQLASSTLVAQVTTVLERHDIPPQLLELEITESVFMRDLPTSTAIISQLRELGVACSIDDFGTGFSGLSYLADLPIDSLKVDQKFVSRIRRFYDEAPIIDAIIGMARALHLNVVAEGVETADQARFLADHGCSEVQGYLFSPPRPADDVAQLLAADDEDAIGWFSLAGAELATAGDVAFIAKLRPILGSEASILLASLCSGQMPEERRDEIAELLADLVPNEARVAMPSPLRTASMRVAAGSFAGLMPITAGLAAANALPAPIQNAVSAAFKTAGITVPRPPSGTDNLLADAPHNDEDANAGVHASSQQTITSGDAAAEGHHGHRPAPRKPHNENHGHGSQKPAPPHDGKHNGGTGNGGNAGQGNGGQGSAGNANGNGGQGNGNGGNAGQGNGNPGPNNPSPPPANNPSPPPANNPSPPPANNPGANNPGANNPGANNPGKGTGNGGQGNAGKGNPGKGNPGKGNPGKGNPGKGNGNGGNAGQGNGNGGNGGQGNGGQGNAGNGGNGGNGSGGQGNGGQGNAGNGGNGGNGNGGQGNGNGGNAGQGNAGQGNGGQGNAGNGGSGGNGNAGQGNGNGGNAGQGNGGQGNAGNGGSGGNGNAGQGNAGQGNAGQGNAGQGNGGAGGNGGQPNGGSSGNGGQGNGGNGNAGKGKGA